MKKVIFKKVLIAFVTALALMFVGVEKAEAQASTVNGGNGLFDPAPGTFVGTNAAKDVLVNQLTLYIKPTVLSMGGPSSPAAAPFYVKGRYFSAIYDSLLNGKSVSVAIGEGLQAIALNSSSIGSTVTRNQLSSLRQEAITLLQ